MIQQTLKLSYNNNTINYLIQNIMKRILFVALAATLLAAGCQKTEIINPVGNAIGFSTGLNKLTKASDADQTGTQNLQQQNFRVWAYCAYEDVNTDATELNSVYDEIKNLKVTYTPAAEGVSESWGTAKEYFWPGQAKELRFFAVSASEKSVGAELSTEKVVIPADGTDKLEVKDFVVDHQSPNEDLMVADFVKQHQGDKVVDLTFHHTLSKVQFVFKTIANSDAKVYVQELKVADMQTKGTLTVTPKSTATVADEGTTYQGTQTPVAFTWTPSAKVETEGSATVDVGAPQIFFDDWKTKVVTDSQAQNYDPDFPAKIDGADATADDKVAMKVTATGGQDDPAQVFTTWLMLPQSVAGKKVEITYLINQRKFTSIFPLESSRLTDNKWVENQYIKYTITLAPNLISFNPSVEEWTPTTEVSNQN